MTRKNVLVFRELPPDQLARLQAAHEVTVANPRDAEQRDRFFAALGTAQGLIGSSFRIDAGVLAWQRRMSWCAGSGNPSETRGAHVPMLRQQHAFGASVPAIGHFLGSPPRWGLVLRHCSGQHSLMGVE